MRLRGEILLPDGSLSLKAERNGPAEDGPQMGTDLADELLGRAPPDFFELIGISDKRGSPPSNSDRVAFLSAPFRDRARSVR